MRMFMIIDTGPRGPLWIGGFLLGLMLGGGVMLALV